MLVVTEFCSTRFEMLGAFFSIDRYTYCRRPPAIRQSLREKKRLRYDYYVVTNKRRELNAIKRELQAVKPDAWNEVLPPQPSILPPPPGEPFIVRNARRVYRVTNGLGKAKSRFGYIRPKNIKRYRAQMPSMRVQRLQFTTHESPQVSIVIPVYNKFDLTCDCLESLQTQVSDSVSYEVIVVDNASKDSSRLLAKVKGLKYIRNAMNEGFVGGCNSGASKATGKYIVFLNNDALVTPNWLESLVSTIESSSQIGLVGSKILYPDGRLQEAGGIIYNNGTGANYGKNDHPDRYQYNYVREVDYCSGASIIVARELFESFGGFDELYAPAYYEDTDLAFKVRAAGLKVLYQPESVIYHIEGATSGTDTSSGFKKYQTINHKKFLRRWSTVLKDQHYGSADEYLARDRSGQKLALIVDEHTPTPDKDSGSVRMFRIIRLLQELGYKVTFFPNYPKKQPKYTAELQQLGVEIVYGPAAFETFIEQYGQYYDAVFLSRPRIGSYYLDLCQAYCAKAKIMYDTVDLHYLRLGRQADFEDPSLREQFLTASRKSEVLEKHLIAEADTALVVSDMEKAILEKDGFTNIAILSNVHILNQHAYEVPFKQRGGLLFVGGFAHLPNIDAITWFVDMVLPIVLKALPDIKLHVVGSDMPISLKKQLKGKPGVIVEGFVEDLEPILTATRVFVAPMRYGAGVKGKIGQAIEFGIPVATTSIGAEGMFLKDRESCLESNDPAGFAKNVIELYRDEQTWQQIQTAARLVLDEHFSEKRAKKDLEAIL
jgi:GT2 family glycosyltransferase/glycosyltransferase involved in cell wall biosynthesis